MKRYWFVLVTSALLVSACGGTEPQPSGGGDDNGGASSNADPQVGAEVVELQPPGTGIARVDGLEFTFDQPGGVSCNVESDDFVFSYVVGDNEVVFGGGASISGGQWTGSLTLQIFSEEGVTAYAAKILDNPDAIAIDGNSVSYSGPMEQRPPISGGTMPDPVDVGDGVFSATC